MNTGERCFPRSHLHFPAPNHNLLSKSGGVRQVQVSAFIHGQAKA